MKHVSLQCINSQSLTQGHFTCVEPQPALVLHVNIGASIHYMIRTQVLKNTHLSHHLEVPNPASLSN